MIRTRSTLAVAEVMLSNLGGRFYGYELYRATGVRPGTLYPMLSRMMRDGLLWSYWEDIDDLPASRPLPRKYYLLTDEGRAAFAELIQRASTEARMGGK